LIVKKIIKIVASRCVSQAPKYAKNAFAARALTCQGSDPPGLCPRPRWGAYRAIPIPLAGFKGATSKRREKQGGEMRGKERKGKGGESGGKGHTGTFSSLRALHLMLIKHASVASQQYAQCGEETENTSATQFSYLHYIITITATSQHFYTVFRKKHPLTFSFISPWKMFRFMQHFQGMLVRN